MCKIRTKITQKQKNLPVSHKLRTCEGGLAHCSCEHNSPGIFFYIFFFNTCILLFYNVCYLISILYYKILIQFGHPGLRPPEVKFFKILPIAYLTPGGLFFHGKKNRHYNRSTTPAYLESLGTYCSEFHQIAYLDTKRPIFVHKKILDTFASRQLPLALGHHWPIFQNFIESHILEQKGPFGTTIII